MKTIFIKGSLLAFFLSVLFISCQQEEEVMNVADDQEEESILESTSVSETESDDILEVMYLAESDLLEEMSGGRVEHKVCATITHDEENKQIIIDFGDGCTGPRGRRRSGKIIITYSSEVGDNIANRIITFENYFVNNKGITGMIELRDVSKNEEGNWVCTKRVTDLTITFPNGQSITFNGSRTREWIGDAGDDDPTNNLYRITGSLSGIATNGRSFTNEITEPVIIDWSCAAEGKLARIAGRIRMTKLSGFGERVRVIDYGDGECDNIITITTLRRVYTIIANDN